MWWYKKPTLKQWQSDTPIKNTTKSRINTYNAALRVTESKSSMYKIAIVNIVTMWKAFTRLLNYLIKLRHFNRILYNNHRFSYEFRLWILKVVRDRQVWQTAIIQNMKTTSDYIAISTSMFRQYNYKYTVLRFRFNTFSYLNNELRTLCE